MEESACVDLFDLDLMLVDDIGVSEIDRKFKKLAMAQLALYASVTAVELLGKCALSRQKTNDPSEISG